jgi:hypothetical protein
VTGPPRRVGGPTRVRAPAAAGRPVRSGAVGTDDPPTDLVRQGLSTGPRPGAHVTDLGTLEWCWARLLTTTEGVLFARRGLERANLSVHFRVEDGQVQIPIGPFPGAAHLLGGATVTLGLAGHADDGLRWVVRATGTALLSILETDSLTASRSSHPARRVEPQGPDALLLNVDRLRGYHQAPTP